jgi:hypothetical protein
MGFFDQVITQQQKYLKDFDPLSEYPKDIREYIFETTKRAATDYMNAGYGGEHHDGGAGRLIHGLKEFVRGYDWACGNKE